MFTKILIANRGEIACRVIRTAQCMGIQCVAVYSEADRNALHVEMADEAICIGAPPPQESYLNIQSVLQAAQQSGCQAIHPGYGFLSENPVFARAVRDAGLILIGPSPEAMEVMGDKIKAKELARSAGVTVIPGSGAAIESPEEAQRLADEIGYPVMLKAAAGGGGKGMRVVEDASDLAEAFERVKNEALTGFGDDRVFVEKFIRNPRHIEFQILADQQGNIIHLGERECSLQRRHQKVIEEAPSPFVNESLRHAMAQQAVDLAQAVNYTSAGTVEFVVDADHHFYFLEMNTRLQVEHPVTEHITGLDLVEEMIRIANGEPLRHQQDEIRFKGHAIEARLYAEDSARGFLPSTGRLVDFRPPELSDHLRLDTGVEEGSSISPYYDPMIAKLIAYGPDREAARQSLAVNLDRFYIRGVETNGQFLSHLLNTQAFKDGAICTNTLDQDYPEGYVPQPSPDPQIPAAAAAVIACLQGHAAMGQEITVLLGREPHSVCVTHEGGCYQVAGAGWTQVVESEWQPGQPVFQAMFNGHGVGFQVDQLTSGMELRWEGHQVVAQVLPPRVAELYLRLPEKQKADTSNQILSPMPGLVVEVRVRQGEPVKAGQPVAVIEAMKMENIIQAPRDGVVDQVLVNKSESVSVDQTLIVLAAA